MEKGKENEYSCLVLAGQRSMQERREALQVGTRVSCITGSSAITDIILSELSKCEIPGKASLKLDKIRNLLDQDFIW